MKMEDKKFFKPQDVTPQNAVIILADQLTRAAMFLEALSDRLVLLEQRVEKIEKASKAENFPSSGYA